MATKRTCNRCGITIDAPAGGTITAVVPAAALASLPVAKDTDFEVVLTTPQDVDYCVPCLISGITAALIGPLALKLQSEAIVDLTRHLRSIDVLPVPAVVKEAGPVLAADVALEGKV